MKLFLAALALALALGPASSADAQRRGGFSHHGSMGHGFGGHRPFFHSHPRSRFFIDGGFFFDPFFFPYYYPYPVPYPEVPPPGWAPGRWESRYDPWGRPYRVWVPPHLR